MGFGRQNKMRPFIFSKVLFFLTHTHTHTPTTSTLGQKATMYAGGQEINVLVSAPPYSFSDLGQVTALHWAF